MSRAMILTAINHLYTCNTLCIYITRIIFAQQFQYIIDASQTTYAHTRIGLESAGAAAMKFKVLLYDDFVCLHKFRTYLCVHNIYVYTRSTHGKFIDTSKAEERRVSAYFMYIKYMQIQYVWREYERVEWVERCPVYYWMLINRIIK